MSKNDYNIVCGMEVHAELKTASKMFCGCKNDPFHALKPNTYTCPVCLGMPGGIPVPNKKAVEWTVKLGLALNCKINLFSHFDRKNYFYPDLAKGYQISQYDQPFCYDGVLETEFGPVRIHRIHLEEDTGKLLHRTIDGKKVSLIDFNRSGVPLVEVVTEPDIHSPEQAKAYAKALRQIMRFLDIADCDMEQGGMRLEANVSMQKTGETALPNYKVEVKNINSFRFLEKAMAYEAERQVGLLEQGETPAQETRGWNEDKGETFSQRSKEDAEDYRYFPDPDIPPIRFSEKQKESLRKDLPELPMQIAQRWRAEFGVETKYSDLLLESKEQAAWMNQLFVEAKKHALEPNTFANVIVNKKLSAKVGDDVAALVSSFKATQKSDSIDESELEKVVQLIISENPDAVAQFKAGKTQVIGFFIGQIQRKLGKKIDPKLLQEKIPSALSLV
jgi:aspartyl-tRNA(Asn)/glutamyl-tRNA(Gln) amidotransferase subunit B